MFCGLLAYCLSARISLVQNVKRHLTGPATVFVRPFFPARTTLEERDYAFRSLSAAARLHRNCASSCYVLCSAVPAAAYHRGGEIHKNAEKCLEIRRRSFSNAFGKLTDVSAKWRDEVGREKRTVLGLKRLGTPLA